MIDSDGGNGKVAIITGTASGMGTDLARSLYTQGYRIGCLDINESEGSRIATSLGPRAIFIKCNVAAYDEQAAAFTTIFEKWARIDALLCNAGIIDRSSVYILRNRGIKEIPPKPDTTCTEVDYFGVLYGVQLAIHFMRQNPTPGGVIVATASVGARHPHPCFPEYNGAKAAVVQFCKTVAPVIRDKDNISINVVLPGLGPTPAIPDVMVESFAPETRTPAATVVAAYNHFLDNPQITGQVVECSVDKHLRAPEPEFLNGSITERACKVYEPLFKIMHGEESGLEGTYGKGVTLG